MIKPSIVLTALGGTLIVGGALGGLLLPLGPYCSGAFLPQSEAMEAAARTGSLTVLKACESNAAQTALVWAAVMIVGLLLVAAGIALRLVRGTGGPHGAAPKTVVYRAPSNTQGPVSKNPAPLWPLLLGLAIVVLGVVLGNLIPVGPNCSGAFASQTSAAGADIANAYSGKRTSYSDQCQFAAGQQAGIYWGIIGFGAAVVILGLVLQTVFGRRPAVTTNSGSVATELEHLVQLLERGVITHSEFAVQKERLLGRR